MLTINNVESLKGTTIGKWKIVDVFTSKTENWLKAPHYTVTFNRDGIGGAVLIDRTENRLLGQYHIYICYENFDKVILETSWSKEALFDKKDFFDMVTTNLDYEWNKRNMRS